MGQSTINPVRTRLICELSESSWVQPTFKKIKFFLT